MAIAPAHNLGLHRGEQVERLIVAYGLVAVGGAMSYYAWWVWRMARRGWQWDPGGVHKGELDRLTMAIGAVLLAIVLAALAG